ncbi:MAG: thiamine diphosphokinase [Pseudomonadota bacterium]
MLNQIVHSDDPVTLVGGAQTTPTALQKALTLAPRCVAADGGAAQALAEGVVPEAVIGDLDSLTPEARAAIPPVQLHEVREQDSTDFEKCLSRISAPVVIGVGFTGGRLDHQLAVLHGLMALAHRPCVLLDARQLCFLAPPRMMLPTQAGDLVSLFPLAPVEGESSGLQWPIEGLKFAPGAQIGTSNAAIGPVTLSMDRPAMLVILPARLIQPVVGHMASPTCARWPAL